MATGSASAEMTETEGLVAEMTETVGLLAIHHLCLDALAPALEGEVVEGEVKGLQEGLQEGLQAMRWQRQKVWRCTFLLEAFL